MEGKSVTMEKWQVGESGRLPLENICRGVLPVPGLVETVLVLILSQSGCRWKTSAGTTNSRNIEVAVEAVLPVLGLVETGDGSGPIAVRLPLEVADS